MSQIKLSKPSTWLIICRGYSIGVIIVVAIVYYLLTSIKALDDLGRATRSRADTQMVSPTPQKPLKAASHPDMQLTVFLLQENILSHLSRIALEHETDVHGKSKWILGSKGTGEEEED